MGSVSRRVGSSVVMALLVCTGIAVAAIHRTVHKVPRISRSLIRRLVGAVPLALLVIAAVASAAGGGRLVWSRPVGGFSALGSASQLSSVSCPTTTLCVAAATSGGLVSTDPTGGEAAWHPLRIELRRVSCPTATFCVGIDPGSGTSPGPQYIVTTTDPAGGPSAWQEFAIPHAKGQFWAGISCGSASLCLAYESGRFNKGYFAKTGGHLMVSTDPGAGGAAWRITSLHDVVEAADCIGHFCILGTSDGAVLTSNDPTSGHWRKVNITGANRGQLSSLGLVACTTSSYCLVGAEGTNAVWYAHKPSSARHWRQLSAIASLPGYPSIFAAGCASSGRCVLAIDELTRASNVAEMISSPAPGGKWRGARVKGQYFGASCPSETMCVAAGSKTYNDSPAQVIAGQSAP